MCIIYFLNRDKNLQKQKNEIIAIAVREIINN
jgi:hypothetical protein